MDKDAKMLLATVIAAVVILWIAKPKKDKKASDSLLSNFGGSESKYKEPKVLEDDKKKVQDDAVTAIKAMRYAINAKEGKKELEQLNKELLKDYGIKVLVNKQNGLLKAMKGDKAIASEEAK